MSAAPKCGNVRRIPGRGPLRIALMSIAASLTLAAWLYASPPGSSPDDGYHLGSIWCAGGFHPDRCIEAFGTGDPNIAIAPAALAELTCVGGDARVPATCINGVYERLDGQLRPIDANLTGWRASLYYRTANLLVSDDIAASIARIRVLNAGLALLLAAATIAIAAADLRRAVLVSWLAASIPLGLFLVTSLNSTAWGLVGVGAFWANSLTALRTGGRLRRSVAVMLALLGALMALGSRTEAAAHLLVTVLALGALSWTDLPLRTGIGATLRRRPLVALSIATSVAAFVMIVGRISGFGYLLESTTGFSRGWERLVERGISNPVLAVAAETPQLWTGSLGTWPLGWLDTYMPSVVWVPATMSFILLAGFGLLGASRGRSLATGVVVSAMLLLPVASLLASGLVVQEQLQARHYLPLLYVLLGIAVVRSPQQGPLALSRGPRLVIASALTIAHSVALTVNINRYTRGLTEFLYIDTNREVAWWWGGWAPSPGSVWAIGTIAFAVMAFGVLQLFSSQSAVAEGAAAHQPRRSPA